MVEFTLEGLIALIALLVGCTLGAAAVLIWTRTLTARETWQLWCSTMVWAITLGVRGRPPFS